MNNEAKQQIDSRPTVILEVGEISKSDDKKIIVRVMEFKGFRYVDLRLSTLSGEKWQPGNGITLNSRSFMPFLELLNAHQEEIELSLSAQTPEV